MKQTIWGRTLLMMLLQVSVLWAQAADVVWYDGQHPVSYQVVGKVDPVVKMALQMFSEDMEQVTGQRSVVSKNATIRIV